VKLDHEVQQTNGLRTENAQALAELSALTTRLEEERKSSQEKLDCSVTLKRVG
jgi:hypothetical protein